MQHAQVCVNRHDLELQETRPRKLESVFSIPVIIT
jgi:hypothetical protein